MVCGLVEQQKIGPLPHDERQREARLLPAREMLDRADGHLAREIEAAEIVAQLLLSGLRRQPDEVPERRLVVAQHLHLVLREITDLHTLVDHPGTAERREHAGDGLDNRPLAAAVAASRPAALACG